MALDIARLAAAITASLEQLYSYNFYNGHEGNKTYFLEQFGLKLATDIITEITGHAQCNGLDSHGDTHGSVGII